LTCPFKIFLQATGKPLVFVNCSGSAVAMPWEAEHLAAIVQAWYPGQAGGTAVADLLFGFSNPSGRLPVTFYRATEDLPPFEDYGMANRTHRFFSGQPLFPFGHGLSYTQFRYDQAQLAHAEIGVDGTIQLSLTLVNTGGRDGDEVVQVYARRLEVNDPQLPRHTLCAFQRVAVPKGQRAMVELAVPAKTLRHWDPLRKNYVVDAGTYELQIGASSEDIRTAVRVRIKAR
jgi:beta-glucosidase